MGTNQTPDDARAALRTRIRLAKNRYCDCPYTRHRWNCALTPTWAQTIRDLDVNPWTVLDVHAPNLRFAPFVWQGSRDRYCGRGPCCLGDNHDGRCRM